MGRNRRLHINKELHEKKLKECYKLVNFLKSLDKDKILKMENDFIKKYDFEYQDQARRNLEKIKLLA
jgi:hypothetical protein